MKKFTIFLLFFLLFVGISHVNAQTPSRGNLHNVTIEGLNKGCLGDEITLTAVVTGEEAECLLQWKKDGQFLGVTTQTYTFTVDDTFPITELTKFTVEVTCIDCEMVASPVFYFQVMPKAVIFVDNYKNHCFWHYLKVKDR